MVNQPEIAGAMLSVQRALLGEVTPDLRSVSVKVHATTITLTTTFDGEYDQMLWDAASGVAAEVIADYPSPWIIEEVIRFRKHPIEAHHPNDGQLAFFRRETPTSAR